MKNEASVLSWLVSSDNRELDDAIEHVNMKMLKKLLPSTPLMAVFFCKFLVFSRVGVKIRNLKVDFKTGGTWRRVGQ